MGSRLYVGRAAGVADLAPVPTCLAHEHRPVLRPDERRRRTDAGQLFQHGQKFLGVAAPADSDSQAETTVLIDRVQEFKPAVVGRGNELELHGPVVGMSDTVTPNRAVRRPGPLALSGDRPLQSLHLPETLHPFVVHAPALSPH